MTSITFGTARRDLSGLPFVRLQLLDSQRHEEEKETYVRCMHPDTVAAFGNGNNDRGLLKAVKEAGGLSVAVDNGEGCALDAVLNAVFEGVFGSQGDLNRFFAVDGHGDAVVASLGNMDDSEIDLHLDLAQAGSQSVTFRDSGVPVTSPLESWRSTS